MEKIAGMLIRVAVVGFSLVLALNLFLHFAMRKPLAEFFTSFWWIGWFPAYLIWLVMLVMGYRGKARNLS